VVRCPDGVSAPLECPGDTQAGDLDIRYGRTAGSVVSLEIAKFFHAQWTFLGTANGSPAEFAAMIEHLAACEWRPVIDSEYALEEISQAHARLEAPERFGRSQSRSPLDE